MGGLETQSLVGLVHDFRDDQLPSMALYADRLGTALCTRGWQVKRLKCDGRLPGWTRNSSLLGKVDSYWGRLVTLRRRARSFQADVFHVVDHGQGFLVGDLDPDRTVVTCHDLMLLVAEEQRFPFRPRSRVASRLLRWSLSRMVSSRFVVAVSENTRRDLLRFAPIDPDRVVVIHPGLNARFGGTQAERSEFRSRHGLEGPVILHVGQTSFYKNIPACLEVTSRLKARGMPVTFLHVGQRLTTQQVALAGRLGIAAAVVDLGPLGEDELRKAYVAADVLLFPSLYEGFGWPPLEAMASGLPVVSSPAGSLAEVVGHAALTAEPDDHEGLARNVELLLSDPRRATALRVQGMERARHFDWDATAAKIEAVYRRVLEG